MENEGFQHVYICIPLFSLMINDVSILIRNNPHRHVDSLWFVYCQDSTIFGIIVLLILDMWFVMQYQGSIKWVFGCSLIKRNFFSIDTVIEEFEHCSCTGE